MAATSAATAAANNTPQRRGDGDTRLTIDIRVFLAVIVVSMTLSFCVGVGIIGGGGGPASALSSHISELPKVTSVMVPTADSDGNKPNNGDGEVHEPAGQVCTSCCRL